MASYNVVQNIDAFLAQLLRLVGNGYYFYYEVELQSGKDPVKTQQRIVDAWGLDIPSWKREKRRRGKQPSIWLLRYDRSILVLSTYGWTEKGDPHPFFVQNEERLRDIRRYALHFCGYSVRYPISKETKKRKLFVRLDKETYLNLKARLCRDGIREQFRTRETMEAKFASLPYQPFSEVYKQMRIVHGEVNKRRRYKGYEPLRLACIPNKVRTPRRLNQRTEDEAA